MTLVEAMAQAIERGGLEYVDRAGPPSTHEANHALTKAMALAALKAMKEYGPTLAMLEAVGGVFVDYEDMLQAAIEEAGG